MKTTIIAEIGTAHQGSFTLAKELIYAAKEAGATCAKFQLVFADEIVHPNSGLVPLPGGKIALYQRFKQLEQDAHFYESLKQETEKAGLKFLCTPFGLKSLNILGKLNCEAYKIASPELNHLPLIAAAAQYNRPLFLSLGVSMLSDIELALAQIPETVPVTLLHCVTSYPAPAEDYNLNLLPHLKALFKTEVGVSDHSLDPILVPALSVYMGATTVEKHICLDHTANGLDDPIALEPDQFQGMVISIEAMELERERCFKALQTEYGEETIAKVLGTGQKFLAKSEKANYGRTNRSICAINDIEAGDLFTKENTALYRVEKELKVGLKPQFWPLIIGSKAHKAIKAGNGIDWDDVGLKNTLG